MGQIGVGAVQAGFDRAAQQEDRGGRAVVRSGAAVFTQAAAEFGEDQNQHPLGFARFLEVVEERRERCRQLAQQVCVLLELAAVGIETVEMSVVDRRSTGRP